MERERSTTMSSYNPSDVEFENLPKLKNSKGSLNSSDLTTITNKTATLSRSKPKLNCDLNYLLDDSSVQNNLSLPTSSTKKPLTGSTMSNLNCMNNQLPPVGILSQSSSCLGGNYGQNSEVQKLREQLTETISKNLAWQKYNAERENYVTSLVTEHTSMVEQNSRLSNELQHNNSQGASYQVIKLLESQRKLDQTIVAMQEELNTLREGKENYQTQFQSLQDTIELLESENSNLKLKLQRCQNELTSQKHAMSQNQMLLRQRIDILQDNNKELGKQADYFKQQLEQTRPSTGRSCRSSSLQSITSMDDLVISPKNCVTKKTQGQSLLHSPRTKIEYERKVRNSPQFEDSPENGIPLVLKYSSSNQSSAKSNRSQRRITLASPSRSKLSPMLSNKSTDEKHTCTFCSGQFHDYKSLIRHYDHCASI